MTPVALALLTVLPALLTEAGQTVRTWLKERRKARVLAAGEELKRLRERVEALEAERRWRP